MATMEVSQGMPGYANSFFSMFNNVVGQASSAINGIAGAVNSTRPLWGVSPPPTPNANPEPTYMGDGRQTANNITSSTTVAGNNKTAMLAIGAVLVVLFLWSK